MKNNQTQKNEFSGFLGLGLALVKKVTEAHGGSIEYNLDEKNSAFIVKLPLKK